MPADSTVLLQPFDNIDSSASGESKHDGSATNDYYDSQQDSNGDEESFYAEFRPQRTLHVETLGNFLYQFIEWAKGPQPPRIYTFKSWFPDPSLPSTSARNGSVRHAVGVAALLACWALIFGAYLLWSVRLCTVEGYGELSRLSCVSKFWSSSGHCTLDGEMYEPLRNLTGAFRCPAYCKAAKAWDSYYVGNEEATYRSIVIGGSNTSDETDNAIYRADSFICPAALHAGLISNTFGGAVVVSLAGESQHYASTSNNGIRSIAFAPSFPQSFKFSSNNVKASASCRDPRWVLLAISILFTSAISLFTESATIFFWASYIITFFTVALATDFPEYEDFGSVVTSAFRRLLPTIFVGLAIYRYWISTTLDGLTARLEKTILWLGSCWIGALDNFTFDTLPLARLTPHDLSQPGAVVTLAVLILVILAIAIGQVWVFRIEGRLLRYLGFYGIVAAILFLLLITPVLHLRLHHYILALLLLPGTSVQTRPSLLYQGLLVGLFINGVARWGFAGVLETSATLYRTVPFGEQVPRIGVPLIENSSIWFDWRNLTTSADTRFSILVNDFERFRTPVNAISSAASFNWTRSDDTIPAFFRMAFVHTSGLGEDRMGKYTKPGTWYPNGTWSHFGA